MRNRSREYLSQRRLEASEAKEKNDLEVFFLRIGSLLKDLDDSVGCVEKECLAYSIPRFTSKQDIVQRIEQLKYQVALKLTKAKTVMSEFSAKYHRSINSSLVESIGVHFHYKLDLMIVRTNASLRRIEQAKASHSERESSSASLEGVYKSVYFISSIIRELKGVVLSQSEKIERLDTAMDRVTDSARKTSGEISSISTFGSQVKNRIITLLFFSILVLILLSAIKAYTHR
ncbi:hypothetical protein NEDG_00444 [Nematocida displodere]|uniref:t-SNARE coiled-coil homology domain-containing protein n=1 Tax=Nematocida displodere TaxID=1805483 RepID=A0A177ELW1_9MICR|nr:hypothetical protein NEDG_00444 [Nematocida displodere]